MSCSKSKGCKTMLILASLVALIGCDMEGYMHKYVPISRGYWNYQDTVTFSIDSMPVTTVMELGVRTTSHYRYSDLWFVLTSRLCASDTLLPTIETCDTTRWKFNMEENSESLSGIMLRQYSLKLPHQIIPAGYSGKVQIYHIMEDNSLRGVHDIGLKLTKLKP